MCREKVMTINERNFPCSQDGLVAAQQFLTSFCDEPKPAIVFDEIVSNIVRCSGADVFSFGLAHVPEGLLMRFADNGTAFDPTRDMPEVDITASAAERRIGGLGIFMVRKMSKTLAYERRDGWNVLTVTL